MIEAVAVEDIISEDHGTGIISYEILTDGECLGKSLGLLLNGILDIDTEVLTVSQELPEPLGIDRGRYYEDILDPREHKGT